MRRLDEPPLLRIYIEPLSALLPPEGGGWEGEARAELSPSLTLPLNGEGRL